MHWRGKWVDGADDWAAIEETDRLDRHQLRYFFAHGLCDGRLLFFFGRHWHLAHMKTLKGVLRVRHLEPQ
jgi:hypothetical protein